MHTHKNKVTTENSSLSQSSEPSKGPKLDVDYAWGLTPKKDDNK